MWQPPVVILGCGYTGRRVAERLLSRNIAIIATARGTASLSDLRGKNANIIPLDVANGVPRIAVPPGASVLYSIPTIETPSGAVDRTGEILGALIPPPARVVYLSTTGVYGSTRDVDEKTPVNPAGVREQLRIEAESAVAQGPWSSMILRPAAIYGPGRGIHVAMARREYRIAGDGQNFVSRIHVEDLAAHCEAALLCDVTGAWPVADEHPCTSREIAEYCAELLRLPMPPSVPVQELHPTRRADRRVDGRAVRGILGIVLRYPSYRVGIPASL